MSKNYGDMHGKTVRVMICEMKVEAMNPNDPLSRPLDPNKFIGENCDYHTDDKEELLQHLFGHHGNAILAANTKEQVIHF